MLDSLPSSTQIAADLSIKAWDIDGEDATSALVKTIHAHGAGAGAYFSAGTWEDWRNDEGKFPASVKGKTNGWPGEKWLDIRSGLSHFSVLTR
ncbi:MAG: endo alpha-1,4 polygalactosaminidase [Frankiaceae bacterium]